MNPSETDALPIPVNFAAAEAILRELSQADADSLWERISEQEAETLLQSLVPARGDGTSGLIEAFAPAKDRPGGAGRSDDAPDAGDEARPLPCLSEATLLDVLETAPDAVVVIDGRGFIVLVNAQTEQLFGYTRQEVFGKKVEMLLPIRNRVGHVAQRRKYHTDPYIRPMGVVGRPLFGLRKDGREFPVEISLSPLKTEHGVLVTSTIRDVSVQKRLEAERKVREAELAKAEARYRSLVEEIPAVTFVAPFDEGLGELYVSPQIVNMLGFTQEEWLNDPVLWHRQLHPEDRERWHQEFARTCATAQPFRSVYRFLARDGRTVWVHGEAKVVRDKEGRPIFVQGVAFDITDRKEAEVELIRLNQSLNDRVAARTKELKRSNDELVNVGYYMAHQLKKPIGRINDIIHGPLRSVSAGDPPEARLSQIQQVARDMEKLVMDLLKYALVTDKGKKFGFTDCAALVHEVRAELNADIEAYGVSLSCHFLPTVFADRESLKTVFFNLIENAIKYRADRPLVIEVTARMCDGAWLFRVSDNGSGIAKGPDLPPGIKSDVDYHKKIFEFGGRVNYEDPYHNPIQGHGIGLSYCQKVIEHHGGKIWVESQAGNGSTFLFTLPVVPDLAMAATRKAP